MMQVHKLSGTLLKVLLRSQLQFLVELRNDKDIERRQSLFVKNRGSKPYPH